MNRKDLDLLERAFTAEINAALTGSPQCIQTRSKRVDALVANGLLQKVAERWHGVLIEGYVLTHAGRFAYCATCEATEAPQ